VGKMKKKKKCVRVLSFFEESQSKQHYSFSSSHFGKVFLTQDRGQN